MASEITREEIASAAGRIAAHIRRSPIVALGDVLGGGYRLSLKLESVQPTGSFKVRGAFSLLTARTVPTRGVVAASGGNFGLAVAYAANRLGHPATIFVPSTSPDEKIAPISRWGAEVRVVPGYYPEALEASRDWANRTGALEAHAYDQPEVVAGQGTCGLEVMEQVVDAGSVLVGVGGGGLIAGIASWVRDAAAVCGVEPENCPTLHAAREAGHPTPVKVGGVAASSLGAGILGDHAWLANRWIDHSILVTDTEILDAQRWLWETCRLVAEPGGCAALAGLLAGRYVPVPAEHVVVVVSGANTVAPFSVT
jgi:threonine dehydratase